MEGIRLIGISICVTAIISAIFSMLLPNGKTDKTVKLAISMFFLVGLISPFVNNRLQFYSDLPKSEAYEEKSDLSVKVNDKFLSLVESRLESSFERLLKEKNIFADKISVKVNINADNSISINKIAVKAKENADEIAQIIYDRAGITADITT